MPFFRLNEIADATGVAPRTIRYYIAQGLLPPPQGSGPAAVYTDGHRDRLDLIGRWKAEYISLREIKRRLAGLSDAKVRVALTAEDAPNGKTTTLAAEEAAPDIAPLPSVVAHPANPPLASSAPVPTSTGTRQQWERITLADGIELHVREDRRQERLLLDALIRQARALLGEP